MRFFHVFAKGESVDIKKKPAIVITRDIKALMLFLIFFSFIFRIRFTFVSATQMYVCMVWMGKAYLNRPVVDKRHFWTLFCECVLHFQISLLVCWIFSSNPQDDTVKGSDKKLNLNMSL
jgi:hypothetical protein